MLAHALEQENFFALAMAVPRLDTERRQFDMAKVRSVSNSILAFRMPWWKKRKERLEADFAQRS